MSALEAQPRAPPAARLAMQAWEQPARAPEVRARELPVNHLILEALTLEAPIPAARILEVRAVFAVPLLVLEALEVPEAVPPVSWRSWAANATRPPSWPARATTSACR